MSETNETTTRNSNTTQHSATKGLSRRRILQILAGMGFGTVSFQRAVAAMAAAQARITPDMIQQAEWIAGVEYSDDDRKLMLDGLNASINDFGKLRAVPIDNAIAPAFAFNPTPAFNSKFKLRDRTVSIIKTNTIPKPTTDEDLAFLPVTKLAALVRSRQVSSTELTKLYLSRLKQHDPTLRCVITLTEESALKQAKRADEEISAGKYRGPLHGIPWGAKDILAYPGYRTTWGAKPYKNQVRDEKATVITRLEEAGAVLVAKLSVGALAWGDVWFDATTKNPWNTNQGSSGSSAGPASAASAGLVGFSIGTETWGSIVSPCTRCGVTGLRPTFGRVSRFGCMALSWSMDKIGPIARSVEDCAIILAAIHGHDGHDASAIDRPFIWPCPEIRTLHVGYVKSLFDDKILDQIERDDVRASMKESLEFDRRTLKILRDQGAKLRPIELPNSLPVEALGLILTAEAATAFDSLTRSGQDDELVRQVTNAWPNVFRQGQLIPAVEYIRANRIRSMVMKDMEAAIRDVDVYVAPSFGGNNLLLTNLTGHPAVVLPNGFRAKDGTPTSITFTGKLFGETEMLAIARNYQQATNYHLQRPPM